MRLYTAGPMRGYPAFNAPMFASITHQLRDMDHVVFNPAEKDTDDYGDTFFDGTSGDIAELESKGFDLRKALAMDLAWIAEHAEAICVLPGWKASAGARAEVALARAIGIPVAYVNDIDAHGVKRDVEDYGDAPLHRLEGRTGCTDHGINDCAICGRVSIGFAAKVEETICQEADRVVSTDRRADYGHPLDNWTQTAAMWSAILGVEVTAEQGLLCMIAAKISRETNAPKRDNLVDIAGYAKCVDLVIEERARRQAEA